MLCVCKVFVLCFLDTERSPGFVLRVPLVDIFQQPTGVAPHALTEAPILPDPNPLNLADVKIDEAPLSGNPPTTTTAAPTFIAPAENPLNLTDADIDGMLKILEGGGALPNRSPVDIVYDQDLERVLNMDIGDFSV